MTRSISTRRLHRPRWRLSVTLLVVVVALFVIELAVMRFLPALGLSGIWKDVADSCLLALLAIGPLYFLGFRTHAMSENGPMRPDISRLFRHFMFLTAFVGTATLLLVTLGLRHILRDHAIAEARHDTRRISAILLDREVKELMDARPSESTGFVIPPERIPELDRRLRAHLPVFDVVKIKIFDRETRVIYSTDPTCIGSLNPDSAILAAALGGATSSKLEHKDSLADLANELRFDVDVVETYTPMVDANGTVIGSFEIYKDVTRPLDEAAVTLAQCAAILAVVLIGGFAGLSVMMHRSTRTIRSRTDALEEAKRKLHANNEMLLESLEREKRAASQLERKAEELGEYAQELEHVNQEMEAAKGAAETATRTKSEFLANMSHEIRTPMTAILGFTENLLDPDLSLPERIVAIHTIHNNGEYLLTIINDILDLSKIEAGKMTVEQIACSPCRLVAEVTSLVKVRAEAKKLPFSVEYAGPMPETIRTDPTRLRQILINLIGNAIKFTETGGVRLVVLLCEEGDEPTMQFDIVDTGVGMSREQAEQLFQAFTQADSSTTRKFGGTGLGLTISKRLAAMLGGDIVVADTEEGIGTRFRATVATGPLDGVKMIDDPMTATVVSVDGTPAMSDVDQTRLENARILLAEDGPDNRRLLTHILEKAGAQVAVAENGQLAADTALAARDQARPFDVILMDMQMPVMDGYEATALLRRKGYTRPIIALTAHAMASDREKCINAGCDDFASKPVDRKKLVMLIHRYLHEEAGPTTTDKEASTLCTTNP